MEMFMKIQEYIEDAQTLVCVLIGEVGCFEHVAVIYICTVTEWKTGNENVHEDTGIY